MSVEIIELNTSRSFSQDATTSEGTWNFLLRVIDEASPEDAIMTALVGDPPAAPFFWEGLSRRKATVTNEGGGIYSAEVPYKLEIADGAGSAPDPTQSPTSTEGPGGGPPSATPSGPTSEDDHIPINETIEIGGRPPHILRSRGTLYKIGLAGVAARDFKGAINVQQDGKVEGCEVPDPPITFTIDMQFDFVTYKYIRLLEDMVWKTNDAQWRQRLTYSVAFLGASLKTNQQGRVDVSFKFGVSPWQTIAVDGIRDGAGGAGTGLPATADAPLIIPGWHYLWVTYADENDAISGRTVQRPREAYVERILDVADFTTLGIGG